MTLKFHYAGLSKIISGGQAGVDQGGLAAAQKMRVATGGTAPSGWKTCRGPNPMLEAYGLECSGSANYNIRTSANIKNSDATLVIARDLASPGTIFTLNECGRQKKPYYIVELDDHTVANLYKMQYEAARFIAEAQTCTLNVAGNRDRGDSMLLFNFTECFLSEVLHILKNDGLLATG